MLFNIILMTKSCNQRLCVFHSTVQNIQMYDYLLWKLVICMLQKHFLITWWSLWSCFADSNPTLISDKITKTLSRKKSPGNSKHYVLNYVTRLNFSYPFSFRQYSTGVELVFTNCWKENLFSYEPICVQRWTIFGYVLLALLLLFHILNK